MIQEFEKKYSEFLRIVRIRYKDSVITDNSISHVEEIMAYKKAAIAYINIINHFNWDYTDFISREFKQAADNLIGNNNFINDEYNIDFDSEFYKEYLKESDWKLTFLFMLIDEKEPRDITNTLCYVIDIMLLNNNWPKIYGGVRGLALYDNESCLPTLGRVVLKITKENEHNDLILTIGSILSRISNKKVYEFVLTNLNHNNKLVREEMNSLLMFYKKNNWINTDGDWVK